MGQTMTQAVTAEPALEGVACMHECPDGSEPAGLRCAASFGHLGDHRARDEKGRPWRWTDEGERGQPSRRVMSPLCDDCTTAQASDPVELLELAEDICGRCGGPLARPPILPPEPLPSTLDAVWSAAAAFCGAIRPGAGYPSVADLCEAVAAHRRALEERGGRLPEIARAAVLLLGTASPGRVVALAQTALQGDLGRSLSDGEIEAVAAAVAGELGR